MGTYLSTPVTDKCEESGESLECPDVPCAWGVVDMQGWRKSMEDAHVAVTDIPLQNDSGGGDAKVFGVFDGHGGPEVARFCGLYLVSVLTQQETWKQGKLTALDGDAKHLDGMSAAESDAGKALRSTFHALDRMIEDMERRDEILILRNEKPPTGERREATAIPPAKPLEGDPPKSMIITRPEDLGDAAKEAIDTADDAKKEEPAEDDKTEETSTSESTEESTEGREKAPADDDSNEAVGKEEAAEMDRDMMDDENDQRNGDAAEDEGSPSNVTAMFQKILSIGTQTGQVLVNVGAEGGTKPDTNQTPAAIIAPDQPNSKYPTPAQPTKVLNGRMICNLPDHSIHAGATAIVAVLTGRVLTVANAGDSRAVMCRAEGKTLALSFDHKPQQDIEINRITKAGGFVNQFGRVNGNLNLSRSIGDLKYKQGPGIPPSAQIITAEPDIVQVYVEPDDEFIILGCDGIWDCLTNENAVKYVRERIDGKSPVDIGKEMLTDIISEDPRVTQGIGGDNMTIMIIDLQPSKRKWRTDPPPPVEAEEKSEEPAKSEEESEAKEDIAS
eukprot:CAMPEP_0176136112 /NCGR_PEP_ID=MMETSP0120_2-20121206/69067_1 /TAXON_ID=160619 /ORGANISM="Kryptoperidinium foliaceum, Strain CCMP 1326" /LENGTH=557 /DNA_ID=CAMNT_0017471867 /DNA_START=176 /DNA_END=1849 /DNA_ORIENTATION=-